MFPLGEPFPRVVGSPSSVQWSKADKVCSVSLHRILGLSHKRQKDDCQKQAEYAMS